MTVYSDIHCPWATLAVHRLRAARDAQGLDVLFDQRAWPLEWVNGAGTPRKIVEPESIALTSHEPALFGRFQGSSWPSTFLPAFELVAAARRVAGLGAAEAVDYRLRVAFFAESMDLSVRSGLAEALQPLADELDVDAVMHAWDTQAVRADVGADYVKSKELPIQGSPQIFWPDGSTSHNPGMTEREWVRGVPVVADPDPDAPARLLAEHVEGARAP